MKILIIRFSSIGDIVLTTPVVRALKEQVDDCEIHFVTKVQFEGIVANNPRIEKVHTFTKSIREITSQLREENFDIIIDLHNNIRSFSLKIRLRKPSFKFPKLNVKKWLLVKFKWNLMPDKHIVERYFEAVRSIGVKNDRNSCEFFIPAHQEIDIESRFGVSPGSYVTVAIGAQFMTKRMPIEKLIDIIQNIHIPIIILGGPSDAFQASELIKIMNHPNIQSACGEVSLDGSASIVKQSAALLTNDTGMMHIASCFNIPTVSVWGNTVPDFGMYPYFPRNTSGFSIHEVKGLNCRPCSKIGFQSCPKSHFRCMYMQNSKAIAEDLESKSGLIS